MNALAPINRTAVTPLAIDGLTKSFRGNVALDDLTFTVATGELTVVLGAAGAGKTTLLRSIAGLELPDQGAIHINGCAMAGLEPKDRDLAMIFDNLALYPDKSGYDNIANPLRIRGQSGAAIELAVKDVAARLKIAHILGRKPKTMSGGERQRVALGRALVRTPSLFLLDEPLSSLDAMLRIELRAELRRLQSELGYTFLMTTPDFSEAMAIADRIVMLREGRIVQIADPQTLYDAPADRDTARFVGAPEINLVDAAISAAGLALAGVSYPVPQKMKGLVETGVRRTEIGIRPEDITITLAQGDGVRLFGTVTDIEALGASAAVTVDAGGVELRLVALSSVVKAIGPGLSVGLSIDFDRCHAFDPDSGARLA